jgi:glycosyltransferase involved in cell wall biosynthesis
VSPPSVCLVAGTLPDEPCGIGAYVDRLATSLSTRCPSVSVVTRASALIRADRPYRLIQVDTSWRLADLPMLRAAVARVRADVVHVQFPGIGYGRGLAATSLPIALRLLRRRPRLVFTIHEFLAFSPQWRWRVLSGMAFADLVTAPDPDLAAEVARRLAWVRVPVRHIPLGSNVGNGGDAVPAVVLHRTPDELVVGFWGFFGPDKGLDDLLDAFVGVRSQRPARLVFVGAPGSESQYWATIQARIDQLGLRDDVLELGWVAEDQLAGVLHQFDVCVLPFIAGLTENRTSYAAAHAEGLYVVTTGSQPGYDAERNTSFVRPRDVDALATEILAATERPQRPASGAVSWDEIAELHLRAYADAGA